MLPVSGPGSGCRSLPLAWARRSDFGREQMGAKDWLLVYADGEIRPVLQSAPVLNRQATRTLVRRLYPGHQLRDLADGTLLDQANPDDDRIYAGCFAGLTVVCTSEAALDRPSQLDLRFRREAGGLRLHLHAMHSVVDWFAYAIWSADGALVRALSVSPLTGIAEDIGGRLAFEQPYWSGQQPVAASSGKPYPFPFHPLELGEAALLALFGFNYEGLCRDGDPDLERIPLAGFALQPTLGS